MPTHTRLAIVLTSAALTLLTACGDDGSEPRADASTGAASDSGCTTTLLVTYPDGTEATLDRAEAVALADGGAFTVYAGDYDIPTDDITSGTITPPPGSHQANVYLTVLGSLADVEPITSGTSVPYTTEADVLTFSTILLGDEGMHNQAVDGSGELTVTSVTTDDLCIDVDYSDGEKKVAGTIGATVYASPF